MNEGRLSKSEFSILLVKPNAVKLGLVGKLRQELIEAGFNIVAEAKTNISREVGELIYGNLGEKKESVIEHIVSGESHSFVVYGNSVIRALRELAGHTAWKNRTSKGMRGKYAQDHTQNSVHTPDSHRESVDELRYILPNVVDSLLASQLADELYSFMNDEQAINNGERLLSPYAV